MILKNDFEKNVFVIIGSGWSRDVVIDDIDGEGYDYDFYFGHSQDIEDQLNEEFITETTWREVDTLMDIMAVADEVWCFGNCERSHMYMHAKEQGYDVWQMG